MNNFDTSMWKEFKIGDVLDIRSSNGIFHANALNISEQPFEGSHPYVVRSSKNNGIRGYIKEDEAALNPAKTISFAQDTAEMFYQEEAYFTGNNVKVASIKDGTHLNEMSALFIITALRKSMSAFHWGMSFELEKIKDIKDTTYQFIFNIPLLQGQPHFEVVLFVLQKRPTRCGDCIKSSTLKLS